MNDNKRYSFDFDSPGGRLASIRDANINEAANFLFRHLEELPQNQIAQISHILVLEVSST